MAVALSSSGSMCLDSHPTHTSLHDDLMMARAVISKLLQQQVSVKLSAVRRGDALMLRCVDCMGWRGMDSVNFTTCAHTAAVPLQ